MWLFCLRLQQRHYGKGIVRNKMLNGLGMSMLIASFVTHWQNNFLISAVRLLLSIVIYAILNQFMDKRMADKGMIFVPYLSRT